MADYDKPTDTHVRDTRYVEAPPREGSGTLWFIVGGVVVALAIIFAVMYGGADSTAPAGGADTGASVTIDNNAAPAPAGDTGAGTGDAMAPPADTAAPADQSAPAGDAGTAPAGDAGTAPADGSAAPADQSAPAPAGGN